MYVHKDYLCYFAGARQVFPSTYLYWSHFRDKNIYFIFDRACHNADRKIIRWVINNLQVRC
jgi:hypothetical protein